jgi:hypothetical protein
MSRFTADTGSVIQRRPMSDAPVRTMNLPATGSAVIKRYIKRNGVDIEVDENYQPIKPKSARGSPYGSPNLGPRNTMPVTGSSNIQQQPRIVSQSPEQSRSDRNIVSGPQNYARGQTGGSSSIFITQNKPSETQGRSNYTAQFAKPTMGGSYNQSSRMSASSNQGLPEVIYL